MEKFDIAIVGGGPAGSTLARLINPKIGVVLIDGMNDGKPCGGLLAPDAQKSLAKFDLTLPKETLVDPQIFSVRTMDLETKDQRWYQRMYMNVDRYRFDQWLLSLASINTKIIKETVVDIVQVEDGFQLQLKNQRIFASIIIGADGAGSLVRKKVGKPINSRKYVAIQQWFDGEENKIQPFYSCIFDSKTSDCCSWIIGKDGKIIFGGAFNKQNSRESFEKQKERLKEWGFNLEKPIKTQACQVLRPKNRKSFDLGSKGVFYVGEAAGFISPSSLEGISSAMNSGMMLADCINESFDGEALEEQNKEIVFKKIKIKYKRKAFGLINKLLLKNLKCPFMYWPLLRKWVMKSGLSSIKVRIQE